MNLFTALSQGKGRLNEENLSAMLGFLLSPQQSHGLGDLFLRRFLQSIAVANNSPDAFSGLINTDDPINAEVIFESPYLIRNNTRYVDIDIRIYKSLPKNKASDETVQELYRIAIENKVKPSSANTTQFKDEFEGIFNDLEGEGDIKLYMVFLTPYSSYRALADEYNALTDEILGRHQKVWMYWTNHEEENAVTALIKGILRSEQECEINPISDYLRHTLKAFARHIIVEQTQFTNPRKVMAETGEIDEVVFVDLSDGRYRIERYKSSMIRLFNMDVDEYVVARPILKRIIEEKGLRISFRTENDREKTTREFGRDIIRAMKETDPIE